MFIDVSAQGEKIVNGFRRPQERHTPRGDRRSFGVSQEATHSLTRACAMPLPRSSEASARVMPEICHSLVSRYAEIASAARNALLRPVAVICGQFGDVERDEEAKNALAKAFPPREIVMLRIDN